MERASREFPPLTRIPHLDAPPMPPKKVRGIEMTSAQGQLITRKVSARIIQSSQPPKNSGGTMASTSAPMQTAGV